MRIAVCLSGQSRTWKTAKDNILNYFNVGVDVDFFIHTWDNNTIRTNNDSMVLITETKLDATKLSDDIKSVYNPKAIEVQQYNSYQFYNNPWLSLCYSFMKSIQLMRTYEIDNDITYDIVIKSRLDLNFVQDGINKFGMPNNKFHIHNIKPLVLYSTVEEFCRFPREFNQIAVNDMFFYADSQTMYLLSNIYKWYSNSFVQSRKERESRQFARESYYLYGPGTLLYTYATKMNIYPYGLLEIKHYPVRQEAEDRQLNSLTDWKEVFDISEKWYDTLFNPKSKKNTKQLI